MGARKSLKPERGNGMSGRVNKVFPRTKELAILTMRPAQSQIRSIMAGPRIANSGMEKLLGDM